MGTGAEVGQGLTIYLAPGQAHNHVASRMVRFYIQAEIVGFVLVTNNIVRGGEL